MLRAVIILPALVATAAAQLNIPALLSSLGPAPADDPRFTNWVAPGPNDVRSPCPGLNALANHGFIHHDGRNMSLPHLLKGLAAGLNMGADFTVLIGGLGLLSSKDIATGAFDLNDLDQHNFPIEHDASLSRKDAYFGDDHTFYDPIWQQTLSFYNGDDQTSLLPASKAIANRTRDSMNINPTFTYGFREFIQRYGEVSIYLQAMGADDATGVTRVDWVRELFEQERLPYDLGWRPRAQPITVASLGQMVFELYTISPSAVPEGKKVAADSYKNVFEVLIGGSNVLNSLTNGLSKAVGL
ncbi:Peroxidase [Sphaerulina musiva]